MQEELYYTHSIQINAAITEVWDALINPEMTQQYMYGCVPITDWEEGSTLTWRGAADGIDYVVGKVLTFEPPSKLALTTFDPNGDYEDIPDNHLKGVYILSEQDGGTLLEITQGDFSKAENSQKRYEDASAAWGMVLQALKTLLEEG